MILKERGRKERGEGREREESGRREGGERVGGRIESRERKTEKEIELER